MREQPDATRRKLLKGLAGYSLSATLFPATTMADQSTTISRSIPGTGERLPAIGLGTWQSFDISARQDLAEAKQSLRLLAGQGYSVVDSSPMYGKSEAVFGQLASELGLEGKLFLATKVWTRGYDAGVRQMEESCRLMATRCMDLMQIHNLVDAAIHVKTLREWKEAGRIRYFGISHYHASAYGEVERFMKAEHPDFLQINYSLAEPESAERLLPLARDLGIAVIVNRPFAEGELFNRVKGRALPGWAADFDAASWAQFFLKWILADSAVTCAVPGTRKPNYLQDNMAAARGRLPDPALRARMSTLMRFTP